MIKYARLRERCLAEGVLRPDELAEPPAAAWDELARVHEPAYLAAPPQQPLKAPPSRFAAVRGFTCSRGRRPHFVESPS